MQSVAGKTILITGAAMGMGKIYAQLAVKEGAAKVILWDVNKTALDDTVAELKAKGGNVVAQVVDVSKLEAIHAAAEETKAATPGGVDLLINNAGIVRGKFFWEHSDADISLTMAINSLAPMYITRAFLPGMIGSGRESRVVNIASAAGLVSNPRMSVYCGSKWAAVGWSDSVRLELEQAGHHHVTVTTVCPTYISTGMFEGAKNMLMTPMMTPEYVTDKVWAAMKKGEPMLILPWTVLLSKSLKGILPIRAFDFVADKVFGVYKTMDDFKGRK